MAKLSDEEVKKIIARLFTGNPIKRKEAETVLAALGAEFRIGKGKGSHGRWLLPNGETATLPGKASKDLSMGVRQSLKKQLLNNGVTDE
jgi:predicted RNA binding protein YcfA (HicA-like mRNA interferase family)